MNLVYQRSYRGPLKGVILDWAGTTMDYGCFAPAVAFIDIFKRNGVPITIEQAREPMGAHKKVHIRAITRIEEVSNKWQEVHGQKPNEEDVQKMFTEFVPLQCDCLAEYAELIPGTLETQEEIRKRGLKIGSTTGYTSEMMEILLKEAEKRGYAPDSTVCASEVPAGRPHPWMCIQNAMNLQIYPMEALVKVGDTLPDIAEGLNAGMWTIGLAKTGNEMGMTEKEIEQIDPEIREEKLNKAYTRMAQAGAHYVVDTISDILPILDEINERLSRGERP